MKHFLNEPIVKMELIDNRGLSYMSQQYGYPVFARVAIQGINEYDIEETILEYGFASSKELSLVKANEVTDLRDNKRERIVLNRGDIATYGDYNEEDLSERLQDYYTKIALERIRKYGGFDEQELIEKKLKGEISQERYLINLEKELSRKDDIPYSLYSKMESNNSEELKALSNEEFYILESQKRFAGMKEIAYAMGCFSDDEKTEKFLNGLFISSVDENGVATIGFEDKENNIEKDYLFTFDNKALDFGDEFNKLLKTCNELGYGNGKEFMVLDRNAYNVGETESGEWFDGEIMPLGVKDETNYIPNELSWRELKEEFAYATFDGRVSSCDVEEHINEDLLESLRKYDDNVADEIIIEALSDELDRLWEKDYEDFSTIHADINDGLKELGLEDKLTILTRKGKDFMIIPAFKNDEDYPSQDFYGSPLLVAEKATPEEVAKAMDMLENIKNSLLQTTAEVASERLMERLVELSNESENDDEYNNARTM